MKTNTKLYLYANNLTIIKNTALKNFNSKVIIVIQLITKKQFLIKQDFSINPGISRTSEAKVTNQA
jgi:hypothetical protein